jgi:hypothetical protein
MRILLLGCLFAALAFGQCGSLISTQTLNFTASPNLLPSYGPRPAAQTVTVTPSSPNTWSLTGGTYSTGFDVNGNQSGTGTATVYVYVSGFADQRGAATGLTDTVNFTISGNSCPLTINYTVVAQLPVALTNNLGIPDSSLPGTSTGGAVFNATDLIPASLIGSIPGGSNLLPAQGSSITLPVFGTQMWNCSPANYATLYSSVKVMNSTDNVIYMTNTSGGSSHFLTFPGCVDNPVTFSPAPTISTFPFMWARDGTNNVGYYMSGNQLEKVVVNLGTFGLTTTNPYSYSPSTCSDTSSNVITNGSTDDITPDNWVSFVTHCDHTGSLAHPQICLLDINGGFVEHCRDLSLEYAPGVSQGTNFTLASLGFSPFTNKRYILTNSGSGNPTYGPLYSLTKGGSGLNFEHYMSMRPEAENMPSGSAASYTNQLCSSTAQSNNECLYTGAHSSMAEDEQGHQYWLDGGDDLQEPFRSAMFVIDLDAPASTASLALQNGGNLSVILPNGSSADIGSGCSWQWCVGQIITASVLDIANWTISSCATVSTTIQCTLGSAPGSGLTTGTATYISSVAGCTNANGAWPGASITVSGTTLTIAGATCNASGSGGWAYANTYPATRSFDHEVIAFHVHAGAGVEMHRLGPSLDRTEETYYHAQFNISMDGKYVIGNSNWGSLGQNHVTVMATGLNPFQSTTAVAAGASSVGAMH